MEVTFNGTAQAVTNPRVQRLVLPDQTDAPGYPKAMTFLKSGTYILEVVLTEIGNYTAILQAEFGTETIEAIENFVIEKPFGYPKIEVASDA